MIRPSLHRATPHHFHNTLTALRALRQAGYGRVGIVLTSLTNRKVGENYLAAALFCQQRYGKDALPVFLRERKAPDLVARELEAWIAQEQLSCIYAPEDIDGFLVLFSTPYEGVIATQTKVGGDAVLYIDEKPRQVGAAAIDLVIGQIQRNETGVPEDPKVVMVEGAWGDERESRLLG